jgi:nifR3 family TIM-barrel protein
MNFLKHLKDPIVGLSPMDGVTDAAYRHVVCKYSRPSLVFTEFVNVEGLARGVIKKMPAFLYDKSERPIVGQIFGVEVESFYKAALVVCALGFDGVDINMGCPAKKVEKKGSGAGLIKTPKLAFDIIEKVKKAVSDWNEGISLKEGGVHESIISECNRMKKSVLRKRLTVSVKTRIGYEKPITKEWISFLTEAKPDFISVHGRTLKQMYIGEANWNEIGIAAEICKKAGIMILGNGDVESMDDALKKIKNYGVDGVLAGRAVMGNPWFFGANEPAKDELGKNARLSVALEHLQYYKNLNYGPFHDLKKHLGWYLKGFDGVKELRVKLMEASTYEEAENLLLIKN